MAGDAEEAELRAVGVVGFYLAGPTVSPLEQSAVHDEDKDGVQEEAVSKSLGQPAVPTEKMVRDHNVSHLPFRGWCSACVRGRGKAMQHRKVHDKEDEQLPTVNVDYGFFGTTGSMELGLESTDASAMLVLVVFDRRSKSICAHAVPTKGIGHP